MRRLSFIPYILALFYVTGCEVSERVELPSGVSYTASVESFDDTRTYVDSDLTLRWNADDRISIFNSSRNDQYRFDGVAGSTYGTFTEVNGGQGSGSPVSRTYAVYPYNSSTFLLPDERIGINLPSAQSYVSGTFAPGVNPMVAVTSGISDGELHFRNLCGYLVLRLYGTGSVKSITISGNNGEILCGDAVVWAEYGGIPELAMSGDADKAVTLDCGAGVALGGDASHAAEFWLCLPPVTFSKGFTVTLNDTDGGKMVKMTSASRTLERNKRYRMAALNVVFEKPSPAYETVDMGVSVMWTRANVGASKPEEYGYYFAWGDNISNRDTYSWEWSNYPFLSSYQSWDEVLFTKYVGSSLFGTPDSKYQLESQDDAASIYLRNRYRMPTASEWRELLSNCSSKWKAVNGVDGIELTSKITGNSIFLPAAGYKSGSSISEVGTLGNYWSSSLNSDYSDLAWQLEFDSSRAVVNDYDRCYAYPIRAVTLPN